MRPGHVTQYAKTAQYVARTDRIFWLSEATLQGHAGLRQLVSILLGLVRSFARELATCGLPMDLASHEMPMLSMYDRGSFFRRHVDATVEETDARILTSVYYMNPGWDASCGGALRIHGADGGFTDLLPEEDSLVLFRADTVEHEVRESGARRRALTIWFAGACGAAVWEVVYKGRIALRDQPRATGR